MEQTTQHFYWVGEVHFLRVHQQHLLPECAVVIELQDDGVDVGHTFQRRDAHALVIFLGLRIFDGRENIA